MKITLLPSAVSASTVLPHHYLTSFLINGRVAIDAGSLGLFRSPAEQAQVRHVFLSHSHLDHWASLPTFLLNVFDMAESAVTLHASESVLDTLRRDVFNDRVWPNFLDMSHEGRRFVNVKPMASGQLVEVEGLRIMPVAVDHVVPTLGFIVEDGSAAVVFSSDTAATMEIWRQADRLVNLKAVFLETTFPRDMEDLAEVAKHLTSAGFAREMAKLSRPATFFAVHISPRTQDRVIAELRGLGLANVKIAEFGKTYEF